MGHLYEMMKASGTSALIYKDQVPVIGAAVDYADQFMITCAGQRNRRHTEAAAELIDVAFGFQEVLFDPQTSGGLLISCEAVSGAAAA